MENRYWENCPHYQRGDCPQPEAIDRVFLIPQLLHPSEIEATKQICQDCGKYLDQKRKYPRIKRPLQIILRRGQKTAIEGDIVDISEGGALIRLHHWADFYKGEEVVLEIYPSDVASEKTSTSVLKLSAQVKRIDTERKQLAIIFLGKIDN